MPGLDRTGPEGQGSRTGRQMGKCNPQTIQKDEKTHRDESNNNEPERGFGRRGNGLGRGFGRGIGRNQGRNRGRG